MRDLDFSEMKFVSGAGASPSGDCSCTCPEPTPSKTKNNNGYGNGAEFGPAPGNSGAHNPQLIEANLGPLGVR